MSLKQLPERTEILLVEYAEAGQGCRAQEQYVRATISIYLVLAGAVFGLMVSLHVSAFVGTYTCLLVAGVGWCMRHLVLRHRKIYAALAERASDIEAELQMSLYTQTNEKLSEAGGPTAKELSAFIIGLVALGFLIAAALFAFSA